jgi:hypothetical protein
MLLFTIEKIERRMIFQKKMPSAGFNELIAKIVNYLNNGSRFEASNEGFRGVPKVKIKCRMMELITINFTSNLALKFH